MCTLSLLHCPTFIDLGQRNYSITPEHWKWLDSRMNSVCVLGGRVGVWGVSHSLSNLSAWNTDLGNRVTAVLT